MKRVKLAASALGLGPHDRADERRGFRCGVSVKASVAGILAGT